MTILPSGSSLNHLKGKEEVNVCPNGEYKEEGYIMYEAMLQAITEDIVRLIFHIKAEKPLEREKVNNPTSLSTDNSNDNQKSRTVVRGEPKVGRNDPCPCGSGLKYKKCCGR